MLYKKATVIWYSKAASGLIQYAFFEGWKYGKSLHVVNQLANLMLLTAAENGSSGKSDILPEKWFADKPRSYLDMHCMPANKKIMEGE